MSLLDELKQTIPPPVNPDVARGETLHPSLGPPIVIPSDYVSFMQCYGPGWFTEQSRFPSLLIMNLLPIGDIFQAEDVFDMMRQTRMDNSEHTPAPPPIYPPSPGLLPWGCYDQGHVFYWLTEGEPSAWPIVIELHSEITRYDIPFLEFLVSNVVRQTHGSFLAKALANAGHIGYLPASQLNSRKIK